MIFWEIAKRNTKIHMLRSFLAMLGIVIGVVAISTMGILGNSMVLAVTDSLHTVGDSVIVTPHTGGTSRGFGGGGGGMTSLKITDQQLQQIKRASAPNVAIPVLQTSDRQRGGLCLPAEQPRRQPDDPFSRTGSDRQLLALVRGWLDRSAATERRGPDAKRSGGPPRPAFHQRYHLHPGCLARPARRTGGAGRVRPDSGADHE